MLNVVVPSLRPSAVVFTKARLDGRLAEDATCSFSDMVGSLFNSSSLVFVEIETEILD